MDFVYSMLFLAAVLGASAILGLAIARILNFCGDRKDEKMRALYPDYFEQMEKRNQLYRELWTLKEDYEDIPKEHIDTLVQNEKYVRLADRTHHTEQLEHWRQVIVDHAQKIEDKRQEYLRAHAEVKRLKELYQIPDNY